MNNLMNNVIEELNALIKMGLLYYSILYLLEYYFKEEDVYIYYYNGLVILTNTDFRKENVLFEVDEEIEKELINNKDDGLSTMIVADYNYVLSFDKNLSNFESFEKGYIKDIKTAKHICNLLKTKKNLKNCFVKKFDKNMSKILIRT